jgi:hypothetical protein
MRIEPPPTAGGVTRQAVTLGMAADTGLEALARGLPVTGQKKSTRIVIT